MGSAISPAALRGNGGAVPGERRPEDVSMSCGNKGSGGYRVFVGNGKNASCLPSPVPTRRPRLYSVLPPRPAPPAAARYQPSARDLSDREFSAPRIMNHDG